MNYIRWMILFIPMPFLFHYVETSFANGSAFAFIGVFLLIVLTGVISTGSKLYAVVLMNILSILLSVVLGRKFITPPNESWFNPFGMDFVIILTGVIILIAVIIVRFVLLGLRK